MSDRARTVFAGRPMVVKIGGVTLEDQRESPGLWRALIERHLTHAGGIVLVHGGGRAVDEHLSRLGMSSERREGIRVTPAEQMGVIAGVLAGTINTELVAAINACGGARAVGLTLADAGVCACRKSTRYGFDPGRVGEVLESDAPLVRELLRFKYLPVVSSIGADADGLLNINADDAAAGLARAMSASALVLLTDVPGVKSDDGSVIEELDQSSVERLIGEGVVSGGMIPKVRSAIETSRRTGSPVVITSGGSFEAFLRGEAKGTRVVWRHA